MKKDTKKSEKERLGLNTTLKYKRNWTLEYFLKEHILLNIS